MPSKVLLINANRCTRPDPVFPLGLAHLSAALRRAGHSIVWLDRLANIDRLEEVADGWRPDVVGISLRNIDDVLINKRETFFDDAVSLGTRLRQKARCPIIVGGSGFSLFPDQLLELAGADFGVCGEGEPGLVSLLAALETGGSVAGIPGLVSRQNGKIVLNPPASAPLDGEHAEADWPDAIAAYYLRTSGVLNVQTQRGCGLRCCYCTYPLIEGRRHRRRPPELVAEEFAQLKRLGARYVFIVDSVFNSSARHVTEVCEALLRRNLKMSWGCFLRPQGLTADLVRLMARAGLSHIEFGSDSFCDEVLAAYQKDFVFDDILRSSELARQDHVDFCHFLICGGPGETEQTLRTSFQNSQLAQRRGHHGGGWDADLSRHAPVRARGRRRAHQSRHRLAYARILPRARPDRRRRSSPSSRNSPAFRRTGLSAIPPPATPAWSNACASAAWSGRSGATLPCCSASDPRRSLATQ